MREFPRELRADFQQYYNLDSGGIGAGLSVRHAADLAEMLPRESRCARAMDPDAEWSDEAVFLVALEYRMQQLLYALAGGKDKNGRKLPEPRPLVEFRGAAGGEAAGGGMDVDEMRDFLARPRAEVEHGD